MSSNKSVKTRNPYISFDVFESTIDEANFVYNFYTPDERVNDSGNFDPGDFGVDNFIRRQDVNQTTKDFPRFNLLTFSIEKPGRLSFSAGGNNARTFGASINIEQPWLQNEEPSVDITGQAKNYIQSEDTISSYFDECYVHSDTSVRERLKTKYNLLSRMNNLDPQHISTTEQLASNMSRYSGNTIRALNDVYSNPEVTFVNQAGRELVSTLFSEASQLKMKLQINALEMRSLVDSDLRSGDFSIFDILFCSSCGL